jgi:outer membrane protein
MMKSQLTTLACLALVASAALAQESSPQTLTLEQAHALALRNHPGIAAADYRAEAQADVYRETRAGLLPQVNLYGSAVHANAADTRIMAGGLNNPSVFDRSAYGVGITQLITDFGRTSNLAASARLQSNAERENARATREQVLLDVDRNFFGVLQAQAVQNVARQTVQTRQLLLDRVSILAANKLKSELDVSFARVSLEDGNLLLQKSQNDLDSAMTALSTALGYPEQHQFTLVDRTPAAEEAGGDVGPLIDKALHDRPELASLRNAHDAAERLARSVRDSRLPTLSAVIAAGDSPDHDARLPNDYGAGGIQLSMPLYAGGYYHAHQHEAEMRAKAAAENLRGAEDNVRRDVRVAWLNLTSARDRLRTTQQLARYSSDAYQLADARYRAGSSSIVELSQAQLQLTSAQIAETTARYDVLMQQAVLDFETGTTPVTN